MKIIYYFGQLTYVTTEGVYSQHKVVVISDRDPKALCMLSQFCYKSLFHEASAINWQMKLEAV